MRIVMRSGEPFAFAGLWETWRDPQGEVIPSCTIITTSARAMEAYEVSSLVNSAANDGSEVVVRMARLT